MRGWKPRICCCLTSATRIAGGAPAAITPAVCSAGARLLTLGGPTVGLIGHRGAVRATDRRCAGCGRTAGGLTPRACVMRVCIPETPQIAHLRTPGAVAQSAAPVARPPDARPTASTEIVWVAESGRAARRVDCQDHGERPRARQSPRRTRAPTTYRRTDAGWGQHRHSGWPRCSVATSAATLLEVAPLFCGVPLSIYSMQTTGASYSTIII